MTFSIVFILKGRFTRSAAIACSTVEYFPSIDILYSDRLDSLKDKEVLYLMLKSLKILLIDTELYFKIISSALTNL